jgi:hypothetical protein
MTGLSLPEINQLEREALGVLEYRVSFTREDYATWHGIFQLFSANQMHLLKSMRSVMLSPVQAVGKIAPVSALSQTAAVLQQRQDGVQFMARGAKYPAAIAGTNADSGPVPPRRPSHAARV